MKFSEFEIEIRRLKKVYGEMKYPEERVMGIFDALSSLPIESFKDQVTKFIAGTDKPPFLTTFVEAFGPILYDLKRQAIEKQLENEPDCIICGNCGVASGYSRIGFNSTAFQCVCKRGRIFYPNLAKMHEVKASDYISQREWTSGRWKVVKNKNVLKVVPHDSDLFDERPNARNINVNGIKKPDFEKSKENLLNGK